MALNHALGAIVVLTCLLCYHNSYYCGFVFDDISAIKENRDLRPHSPLINIFFNDFWGTPMHKEQSHKSYRPLCVLTFRWNYLLWQLEPMGYHLVNMLLHSVVCLMYFRMCSMFLPELSSFVAAMLFAVHPIHTEAVTGVVGRAETLSSVFFLAAFILYSKASRSKKYTGWKYLVFSMVSMATAMLCKEQGITVAGVCAAYEIFVAQKVRLPEIKYMLKSAITAKSSYHIPWSNKATKRLAVLASTTFCLLLARLQIMGSQLPVFTRFDNPASVAVTPTRQLTYHYLISVNLWLLLFPCNLCCDWTMGTVPLVESILDLRNVGTVVAYTFLLALVIKAFSTENKQQSLVIIMGTSLMVLPFIPASNLFFPVGFVVAERVLYMPSMGFCMLVGYGFQILAEKRGKLLAYLLLSILLVSHGSKTYMRNWDWENEYSIFMSGLRVNQRNAKLFNNVGHALESQGNFQDALTFFKTAVSVQQDDVVMEMVEENKTTDQIVKEQVGVNKMHMVYKNPDPGQEIVISGISGTFPNSNNVHEFRENLFNKVQMLSPKGRWNFTHPEMPNHAGCIQNIDKFDSGYFGVHERQSQSMDPMVRILQEKVTEAILDAGLHPSDLEGTNTGVYVGTSLCETEILLLYENLNPDKYIWTGCAKSLQAHRLSYFFKLRGPSLTTDSACSSSLFALEHAFMALMLGEIDNAIVCGSHLTLIPTLTLHFARLGALNKDGCCKVFDESANGYTRSETVGSFLLQKAKNANRVYAQVVYAKTNSDGYKDRGITYPSSKEQANLLNTFYEECNIDPNSLSFLEAHGTGTAVGDPEECFAIDTVLTRNRNTPLLIGSVKSNIGHSEPASGLCSVIKCIVAMETGFIPPNINFSKPKESIKGIVEGRMKVVAEKMRFEDNRGLVGINGFGFGGANCHVLLRWNPKEKINGGLPKDDAPRLVCVSGRTEDAITSLLDALISNALDAEYIKLMHNIFRTQKILVDKDVNISKTLVNKSPDNEFNQILGSVAVQIGIIDILKLLEIRPKYCLGYSFGGLLVEFYNGNITLEETITCASVTNDILNDINELYIAKIENNIEENNAIDGDDVVRTNRNNTIFKNLRETLNFEKSSIKQRLKDELTNILDKRGLDKTLKTKHKTVDYIIEALKCNNFQESNCIELNSIVFKIGNCPNQKDMEDIVILTVSSKRRNFLVGLLDHFGRFYEYGYDLQLEKLYPAVDSPVSRGTKMISPSIKWKHSREWCLPTYRSVMNFQIKTFKIAYFDQEWAFLNGHVINGRNLFPATGYLYLVWDTLITTNLLSLSSTTVKFENCKFIRATNIPNKSHVKFDISIQKNTGNFEILNDDTLVATGRISVLDDKYEETIPYRPIGISSNVACSLKSKDVYKELGLRGYNYKGEFRAIQECDSSHSKGYIKWNNNWIAFMDNMLQLKILELDSRLLYIPINIQNLTINPQKHLDWINSRYTEKGKSPDLPVFNDYSTEVISCGGIQIRGLIARTISHKKYLGTPVLESYKFIPNIATLTTNESTRVNMQIILENTLAYKVKVVELIDDYSDKSVIFLIPIILSILEDQPQNQPFVKILSKTPLDVDVEVEDAKLSDERDCLLVIGTNISVRPAVLKDASDAVKEKGYILSREPPDFDISSLANIEVITVHKTPTETLVLFRNYSPVRETIAFKIISANNFSWVHKLKKIIEERVKDDIVIYSENESINGVLGLINCLRREPNGQNIRCIFVMDAAEEFHPNNSKYAIQLQKNMAVNVYKNGQWGTYRHMMLDKPQDLESEHSLGSVAVRGDLSSFRWVEGPLRHNIVLAPESKLAYIYYAALNFRDVMTASAKIVVDASHDRREQEFVEGFEFSGKDEKGNRIMGMVDHGALSNMVLVDSNLIYNVPDSWTLAEAATVPVVYLTVIYAIHIRGELKPSETILIHSGTGGIGQAAIRLALHHGCSVFTTVGTQAKREFLKRSFPQLNDDHIGNSRDESFEQMILKETKGRGVDMVLNSLAEDKLLASVRCLARGGRFIEIGKFDLANNNQLNLLLFKNCASFQGVMLDMMFKETPHRKMILSKFMNEGIQSGIVKPLNKTIFKMDEVEKAFRFMASGKHMGKVIVQIRNPEENIISFLTIKKYHCMPRYWCDPEMTYIMVGGLGGFGLELADWLVLRGAKKLVLTSRSGISTGYQNYRIRIWQSYGIILRICKSDITSKSGCQELIKESQELGPIHGIFNLAVVLKDSIFENQTPDSFCTAFGPKALATQYLDELTRKLCPSLRDFVIFSSVSCGRGNAGQTNYGMANSVMERICENRRQDGYPALAIQWGAVGNVGLVAEMQEQHIELVIGGTLQQPISSCLKVLDGFLTQKSEVILSSMVVAKKQGERDAANNIVEAVANTLGLGDLKSVNVQSTLAELGMDSITAIEIRQVLEKDFDVTFNAKDMRTMTLARLREIQAKNGIEEHNNETNIVTDFGLRTILRLIGTEPESHLLYMRLKSKVAETELAPKLLLFPGLEGFAKVYELLAVRLNAHTVCLQYPYSNANDTIEHMAKSLLPFVEKYITMNDPFKFLAYSFGVLIAIEVVNLLECKGYTGTIICLDGFPLLMNETSNVLNFQSEENLQTALIYQILSILLPNQVITSHKEKLIDCKSWEDRLNLLTKITKDYSISEESYHRNLANGMYIRIKAMRLYNPSYNKLKSKVKLFKAKSPSVQGLPKDYELSQLFESPVEVQTFDGDHITMLNNELLADKINSFISSEDCK